MNNTMSPVELRDHIQEFLSEHKDGALATTIGNTPRSSPVEYFTDPNMNVYIFSAGGDKFKAIEENPNVCLLVNTEYINYRKIKGVQIFGKATTSIKHPEIIQEARNYSPEPYVLDSEGEKLKAIKITPEEIVYLDSLREGDRTKQILKNSQVTLKDDIIFE